MNHEQQVVRQAGVWPVNEDNFIGWGESGGLLYQCPACDEGEVNPIDDNYCHHCGIRLEWPDEQ